MPRPPQYDITFEDPVRTEIVTFSVLCQPKSYQCSADEFCEKVSTAALEQLLPDEKTFADLVAKLKDEYGFRISRDSGFPIIVASCTVDQFEKTFGGHLTRMIRRMQDGDFTREVRAIVLDSNAPPPTLPGVLASAGALMITVEEPPLYAHTPATIGTRGIVCLDLSHVAGLTGASACHTFMLGSGELDRGNGTAVAVVDTGFYEHDFFKLHPYHIERISAGSAGPANEDPLCHGTFLLANLLACAPEVNAYGVRTHGPLEGVRAALRINDIKVISASWSYELKPGPVPAKLVPLQFLIRQTVHRGVTVVVAAGNSSDLTFPASMPEVIAVGGVDHQTMGPWDGTTSFTTASGRAVPDVCGVASDMNLPMPPKGARPAAMMCKEGGTSCAAPQVAGAAALLLQKDASLTPDEVKQLLKNGATRVISKHGQPSTGAGLVNAFNSLGMVP